MSSDFRFIPYPAHRHPDKFPVQGPGNGFRDGCFSDTGRSDKTKDGSLHILRQLPYGQIFDNPLLHLFQSVMILIQNSGRVFQIQIVFRFHIPWQIQNPVQIGPDHRAFRGSRSHFGQSIQLLGGLFMSFLRQICFSYLFFVFLYFACLAVTFAQFLLDRLKLLSQVIFPLYLVNLFFHPQIDLVLDLQYLNFPHQHIVQGFQPFHGMERFQNILLILGLYQNIGGNDIRQSARVLQSIYGKKGFRGYLVAELYIILKNGQDAAGYRLQLQLDFLGIIFLWSGKFHFKISILFGEFQDPSPLQSLDKHPDRIAGQLQQLLYL